MIVVVPGVLFLLVGVIVAFVGVLVAFVRVLLAFVRVLLGGLSQRDDVGNVERGILGEAGLLHCVVHGRLEAGFVDREVGILDGGDLLRRQLDVVWLDPWRCEVVDVDLVAAYLLGDVCERVRRSNDRCAGRRRVVIAARGKSERRRDGDDDK